MCWPFCPVKLYSKDNPAGDVRHVLERVGTWLVEQIDCWVAYEMSVAPKSTVCWQKEFMPSDGVRDGEIDVASVKLVELALPLGDSDAGEARSRRGRAAETRPMPVRPFPERLRTSPAALPSVMATTTQISQCVRIIRTSRGRSRRCAGRRGRRT